MEIDPPPKKLPMVPCLITDREDIWNLYRGPSIDASYQVSAHLVKRFQRGKIQICKVNWQRPQSDGKSLRDLSPDDWKMNNPETSNNNISFQRNVTIIWNRQPPAPMLGVVIDGPLHGKFLRPFPPIGPSQCNLIAHMIPCLYEKFEDTKGVMSKRKMRKGQTMSYKTLHRKLKNEQRARTPH